MNKNEDENGRLIFDIQCKTTCNTLNYSKVIESMNIKKMPLILHRQTEKKGKTFYKKEDYVIMKMDDFIEILKLIDFELFKKI
jgi:3-dehydroquinate dehydratase